jgi:DHA2 family multidrug resistance protein
MSAQANSLADGGAGPARAIVLACLMAGTLMQVLDATIANVALPYIQGSMSASREQITWVLTSYVIASAIMTAPVGWFAARFGRKNVYIACLLGFTAASAMCGASQSLEEIVFFRVCQGAIGAALAPLSQSMMFDLYPPERRSAALALYGTGVMVGPIMGPTLGGYLTEMLNWRWVFYVNVPFGIAAAVGLLLFPSKGLRNPSLRFDWTGFSFLTVGLGALQLMLDRGTDQGWFDSNEIILYALVGAIAVYLFIVHEATADKPLIPRALFGDRSFIAAFAGFLILGQTFNASSAALPPYLQTLAGYSVLYTGLVMSPRGVGTILSMQTVGLLNRYIDPRLQLALGASITAVTLWVMAGWTPSVSIWTLGWVSVIQGFGMGMLFVPLNLSAFATLPLTLRTDGTAIINLARNLGGAVGVSISSAFIAANAQTAHADLAAHVTPFNRALEVNGAGMMWNPKLPSGAAAINGVIEHQSMIIAYNNNFLFLAFLCLSTILAIAALRKPKAPPPPGEGAHLE